MQKTQGYAAHNHTSPLAPFNFERRDPLPNDVQIEILYCGVCQRYFNKLDILCLCAFE